MKTVIKYILVTKGNDTAFTCLGNWYDTADEESMRSVFAMLAECTSVRDRRTAVEELFNALCKTK